MPSGIYRRRQHSNEIAKFYELLNQSIMKKFPNSFNHEHFYGEKYSNTGGMKVLKPPESNDRDFIFIRL